MKTNQAEIMGSCWVFFSITQTNAVTSRFI